MATNESPSFDDLDPVESTPRESGSDWINLETGEKFAGEITAFNPGAGGENDAGVVEIEGRPYSLNWGQRNDLIDALVVGSTMGLHKLDEEESFTDDDTGEEVVYNPTEVRFA
ncbi:hypothetical protein [Haloplanus salinarum]|uniref:hypothetical protein n=1 Tax=Haloplanus salinarum TaxID=1912324 RepID=UPI00214C1CA6|nr:hypothetical protein [Haloplanus salinarum]